MIKFYFTKRSPFARKVKILLSELRSPHDPVEIIPDLQSSSLFGEEYEKLVPSLKVPAIETDGNIIFESNAVMTYLYQTRVSDGEDGAEIPLAPSVIRPEKVWEDTMILTTIDTILDSVVNVVLMGRSGTEPEGHPYLSRQLARAHSCLDWLEIRASANGFWPGFFSVADINLICMLQYLQSNNLVHWSGRSNLEAILALFSERSSVRENPTPEPL